MTDTCSFIMANRLTHDNVGHNPSAAYLFIEEGEGYVGKRLSLTVMGEETDLEKIKAIRRRSIPADQRGGQQVPCSLPHRGSTTVDRQ